MAARQLRLIEICEPFIYEVCNSVRLLSPARGATEVPITPQTIRAQLSMALADSERLASSVGRGGEWKLVEPPLLCFADAMMIEARPGDAFAEQWAGERMAAEPPHKINAGDSAFFEAYTEQDVFTLLLADKTFAPGMPADQRMSAAYKEAFGNDPAPADVQKLAAAGLTPLDNAVIERLEVYYTCLQLGFQGKYRREVDRDGRLQQLRSIIRRALADRRILSQANIARLTPAAYHVVEAKLTLESKPTIWGSVVLVAFFAISCFFFLGWCYKEATRSLGDSVNIILKD